MGDAARDPVDHARTNYQFAGQTMKDIRYTPGLIPCAVGEGAPAVSIHLFAIGSAGEAMLATAVAIGTELAGVGWVLAEHRGAVNRNRRWSAENPRSAAVDGQ